MKVQRTTILAVFAAAVAGAGAVRAQPTVVVDGLEGAPSALAVCPARPSLLAFDRAGSLFLLDTGTGTTERVSSSGTTEAGTRTGPEGGADWMPSLDRQGNAWLVYSGSGAGNRDVYLTYAGAGRSWRLTGEPALDVDPRFSPDGTRIVFVSSRSGEGDLYLIEGVDRIRRSILEGTPPAPETGIVRLTVNPERDLQPSFDPSGRYVAFSQWGISPEEETAFPNLGIAVLDLENRSRPPVRVVLESDQETWPSWSPDGSRIAYIASPSGESGRLDIGLVKVAFGEGSGIPYFGAPVETGPDRRVARNVVPAASRGPSWGARTPAGHSKSLVYVRRDEGGGSAVVFADVQAWESGRLDYATEVVADPGRLAEATWAFDGTAVFVGETGEGYGIYRIPAPEVLAGDRGNFDRLLVPDPGGGGFPLWAAIGGGLAVVGGVIAAIAGGGDDGGGGGGGFRLDDPPCPPGTDCGP